MLALRVRRCQDRRRSATYARPRRQAPGGGPAPARLQHEPAVVPREM